MVKKALELYINLFEKLTDFIKHVGAELGLKLTSSNYWKLLNVMYGHAFDLRVKHKIFRPEND